MKKERREGVGNQKLNLGKLARTAKSRGQVQSATGVGVEHVSYQHLTYLDGTCHVNEKTIGRHHLLYKLETDRIS